MAVVCQGNSLFQVHEHDRPGRAVRQLAQDFVKKIDRLGRHAHRVDPYAGHGIGQLLHQTVSCGRRSSDGDEESEALGAHQPPAQRPKGFTRRDCLIRPR